MHDDSPMDNILHGLPPVADASARVLVLGSMPGAQSLHSEQYYAHPRNRFWPLMGQLYAIDPAAGYPQRVAQLIHAGVALWDVLGSCCRSGSLDSAIARTSEVANPIGRWMPSLPHVRVIALNGGKAAEAFDRHVGGMLSPAQRAGLAVHRLPSTSPANAAWSLARLHERWSVIRG